VKAIAEAFADRTSIDRAAARGEMILKLKALGVSPGDAQHLASAAHRSGNESPATANLPGGALMLTDPEPWPEAVDGAELADEIAGIFGRHIILPEGAAHALTLWVLHAHALGAFEVS